jgi:hypothetical protein
LAKGLWTIISNLNIMSSNSYTYEYTFTLTNAKYLGAKVATDLKRIQRFYGVPSDQRIQEYEEEVIALLKEGYLDTITYGFKKDGDWVKPTIRYKSTDFFDGNGLDDDPGKIPAHYDVTGAAFHSFLEKNAKWNKLSSSEQKVFEDSLSINRSYGSASGTDGCFSSDLNYSSGGQSLNRSSLN